MMVHHQDLGRLGHYQALTLADKDIYGTAVIRHHLHRHFAGQFPKQSVPMIQQIGRRPAGSTLGRDDILIGGDDGLGQPVDLGDGGA